MKYSEPSDADRTDLESALGSGEPVTIAEALLGVVNTDPDRRWLQETCLDLLSHPEPSVRSVAVIALGHVARLHGEIDRDRVIPALERLAADEPALAGRVDDALDDIFMFTEPDST